MSTIATITTALQQETHEPNDDSVLYRHIVSTLKHLRAYSFVWSGKSYTLNLTSGQSEYELGVELPGDILGFDRISWMQSASNSYGREVHPASLNDVRNRQVSGTDVVGFPEIYVYYGQKLILYPASGAGQQLRIDYRCDPGRDEITGKEITVENITGDETNEFLRRGEELVRTGAMYRYMMQRSHDDQAATRSKLLYEDALKSLMRERDGLELDGQQSAFYL